jgi:quercetin dioxygenase-like cupin family protein
MSKRLPPRSYAAALLVLGLLLSVSAARAETAAHEQGGTRAVLSTGKTVTDEPIVYPTGAPAKITAVEITLEPGQQTGWHQHPVPLFGYILEGELTVVTGRSANAPTARAKGSPRR